MDGYYVRIAPPEAADAPSPHARLRADQEPAAGPERRRRPTQIVSPDALALVRFGLRAADDPRIVNTVKVIDALLKVETPFGPAWHRYNEDGYGEHADGAPFDGTGIGRAWPLLTGERAHYELAAGPARRRPEAARRTWRPSPATAGCCPSRSGTRPTCRRRAVFGQAAGSAMPLVWAHAEYIKLRRSLRDGRVFDMPPQTVQRYIVEKHRLAARALALQSQVRLVPPARCCASRPSRPAVVRWSLDDWKTINDVKRARHGTWASTCRPAHQ